MLAAAEVQHGQVGGMSTRSGLLTGQTNRRACRDRASCDGALVTFLANPERG